MTGHDAAEALAAAAVLAGLLFLVRRSGLPRGWPERATRRRTLVVGSAVLAVAGATWSAAIAASLQVAAPAAAILILILSTAELVLAARWATRPRLTVADQLAAVATAVSVGWLVGWSGAVPPAGHLAPGPDQALALCLQVTLLLWLILATRRPVEVRAAGERVGWEGEKRPYRLDAPVVGSVVRFTESR